MYTIVYIFIEAYQVSTSNTSIEHVFRVYMYTCVDRDQSGLEQLESLIIFKVDMK